MNTKKSMMRFFWELLVGTEFRHMHPNSERRFVTDHYVKTSESQAKQLDKVELVDFHPNAIVRL